MKKAICASTYTLINPCRPLQECNICLHGEDIHFPSVIVVDQAACKHTSVALISINHSPLESANALFLDSQAFFMIVCNLHLRAIITLSVGSLSLHMRNEFIVGVCHDLIKWHYHKNSDAVIKFS